MRHQESRALLRFARFALLLGTVQFIVQPAPLAASPVEVVKAVFEHAGGERWHVSVTLRHADTGWEHYADVWVVEDLDGKELGRRTLLHPHEHEQPFTRSEVVAIPRSVRKVRVRAGDNVNGIDSNALLVDLGRAKGPGYEVR